MQTNSNLISNFSTTDFKSRINDIKSKIINEMKSVREKLNTFADKERKKAENSVIDFEDFEKSISISKSEVDMSSKLQSENLHRFSVEKDLLNSVISSKEKEISEMEYLVLQKLPTEFSNFEFIFKKELEIHNKMKMENSSIYSKNEALASELKDMINKYKQVADIELEKTKEGFLKINFFRGIPNSKLHDGASLTVEIKEGSFKIISIFPQIKISHYEEELSQGNNFTLFLTKIANDFIKFIK